MLSSLSDSKVFVSSLAPITTAISHERGGVGCDRTRLQKMPRVISDFNRDHYAQQHAQTAPKDSERNLAILVLEMAMIALKCHICTGELVFDTSHL